MQRDYCATLYPARSKEPRAASSSAATWFSVERMASVPRLKQFLHASTGRSYGISQEARSSSSHVVRGRSFEYGQPILDSGYPIRADGPAAPGVIERARLSQLRGEHAGKPCHLLLGRCEISLPDLPTVCPHDKGRRYRRRKQ
jgi:hypothetical protein